MYVCMNVGIYIYIKLFYPSHLEPRDWYINGRGVCKSMHVKDSLLYGNGAVFSQGYESQNLPMFNIHQPIINRINVL